MTGGKDRRTSPHTQEHDDAPDHPPHPTDELMIQIDRWTTASSNCLGYAPEDGELVKYEDHFSVVDGLETLLRRAYTVIPDGVEVRADIHRALNAEDEAEPPSTPSSSGE